MPEPAASAPPGAEEPLAALARFLERADGFALAFVECNRPLDALYLARRLAARIPAAELREVHLAPSVVDLHAELTALRPPLGTGQALWVTGFEQSIPSEVELPPALDLLNRKRERFHDLPCPLVLVLPEYALSQLARAAPDFWAWRSLVVALPAPAPQRLPLPSPLSELYPSYASLSAEQKRSHARVLKSVLDAAEPSGPQQQAEHADLYVRLHLLHELLGEHEPARAALEKARELGWQAPSSLPEVEPRGDRSRELDLLRYLGILAQQRGDVPAARALLERSLALADQLGNRAAQARSLLLLGMVAQEQGDLMAAERHYQLSLALTEEVGDVSTPVLLYHRLGTLAELRGDVQAAEMLYRQALALAEQLGNVELQTLSRQALGRLPPAGAPPPDPRPA